MYQEPIEDIKVYILVGYPCNILGYPSKYCNNTSNKKLRLFPHSPWTQPVDNFFNSLLTKILLNITDVEFNFRMGCILVLSPFL